MIYVVSGMGRSGTSMMMNALIMGGVPGAYEPDKAIDRLAKLKANGYDANPNGVFELYKPDVVRLFPDGLDGYAVKIADFMWERLQGLASQGINVVYILRNREDVCSSMKAFNPLCNKEAVGKRRDSQLDIIRCVMSRPDVVNVTVISYEDVIADPLRSFEILKEAGFPINVVKAASVVNPNYQHFKEK